MNSSRTALLTRQFDLKTQSKALEKQLNGLRQTAADCKSKLRQIEAEINQVETELFAPTSTSVENAMTSSSDLPPDRIDSCSSGITVNHRHSDTANTAQKNRPGLVPNEAHRHNEGPISPKNLSKEIGCVLKMQTNNGMLWHEIWCRECGQNSTSKRGLHYMTGFEGFSRHYRAKHPELCIQHGDPDGTFRVRQVARLVGRHPLSREEIVKLCTRQAVIKTVVEPRVSHRAVLSDAGPDIWRLSHGRPTHIQGDSATGHQVAPDCAQTKAPTFPRTPASSNGIGEHSTDGPSTESSRPTLPPASLKRKVALTDDDEDMLAADAFVNGMEHRRLAAARSSRSRLTYDELEDELDDEGDEEYSDDSF